mmetsp:Transcript_15101/g.42597  ORF Transcript_15101/g.42597 Transcript_15101/m.42597 type:complete len:144 (+) Transcript_15101:141-572(+)
MASKLRQIATTLLSQRALRNATIAKAWSIEWKHLLVATEENQQGNDENADENENEEDETIVQQHKPTFLESLRTTTIPNNKKSTHATPIADTTMIRQRLEFARHPIMHDYSIPSADIPETTTNQPQYFREPIDDNNSHIYLAQ